MCGIDCRVGRAVRGLVDVAAGLVTLGVAVGLLTVPLYTTEGLDSSGDLRSAWAAGSGDLRRIMAPSLSVAPPGLCDFAASYQWLAPLAKLCRPCRGWAP